MVPVISYNLPIIISGAFTWGEFCLLRNWGVYAHPESWDQVFRAKFLFTQLQPLRNELGKPIHITSGVRTAAYTQDLRRRHIPAALYSEHNNWDAVDVTVVGMSNVALWQWFDKRWAGRMENIHATPGWCHLDCKNWGRKERFDP